MQKFLRGLLLSGFLGQVTVSVAQPVIPAELRGSWWLDGSAGLDISGLSFCDGELLAVSDKDSTGIYRIRLDQPAMGPGPRTDADSGEAGDNAVPAAATQLEPYRRINGLDLPSGRWEGWKAALLNLVQSGTAADFEGISCSGGDIYMVSERHHRVAQLPTTGDARWLPPQWADGARERGFMLQFNGASEGLVRDGEDTWIAMERDGRGLVRLSGDTVEYFRVPGVPGLDFRGRSEDLTGLDIYDGALYTLERNAFAVCRRALPGLRAQWCINYRAVEERPEYIYRETYYGKAEGLAVRDDGIFVVLDNNNLGRVAAPDDRRGLLLQLAHPPAGVVAEAGPE
ncbi:esterase-like activity of phytase family protein [Microbulbifer sp. YPW16]|uniref:esterase-like activity of phytase family protein n=1 Tax=Microbulbifer sp. YPW16 TaxID=2904242 RepID=UPI001E60ECAB|nr:esterase-like activity of phytase family protein [Microbulbifer sp. YPW16]UHQ55148.1 esterase-like activity of phytase family protein [Microbulbifer sp. YPW16]